MTGAPGHDMGRVGLGRTLPSPMSAALPSPGLPVRRARALAAGTCGELAQGVLPDGTSFVVTCPIDRGTAIEVAITPAQTLAITGVPPEASYLERALRRTAELLELGPCRISVDRHSALYVAKGMASSTADIVAAARALSAAASLPLRTEELAELAAAIEPTDGIMYDGIVAADPGTGLRLRGWDWWPQFVVVMAIPPTTFETSAARFPDQDRLADEYADLLDRLDAAVEAQDAAAFAEQATRSARLNEAFHTSPVLADLELHADRLGALGACVAHTGTVAGLLFPATPDGHMAASNAARDLEKQLSDDIHITTARTPAWPGTRPLTAAGDHQRRSTD